MEKQLIKLTVGEIIELQLNNPPLNLFTIEMTKALHEALTVIRKSSKSKVLIVTGGDRQVFCAGSDIKEFKGLVGNVAEGKLTFENKVFDDLAALPIPTIAAIEKYALGGGLELALCCDLRVISSSARIGLPEVKLGGFPGSGGTQRLPRLVGPAKAKELIFTGDTLSAEEALRIGLVNVIAPSGKTLETAKSLAQRILVNAPLSVQASKRLIDLVHEIDPKTHTRLSIQEQEKVFSSEDMKEGVAAFLDKREPHFKGS